MKNLKDRNNKQGDPERNKSRKRKDFLLGKEGRDHSLGFVHIPKTGGTGVFQFGKAIVAKGHKFPLNFSHGWSVPRILDIFPDLKVSCIIRDPLERTISGFNSRLRMGRPQNSNSWKPDEAVSFSFFSTADQLLQALDGKDDRLFSAADYALNSITHLKHNYKFYFESVKFIEGNLDRIAMVREISQTREFLVDVCNYSAGRSDLVDEYYEVKHISPQSTGQFIRGLLPESAEIARQYLSEEYEIYNRLKLIADSQKS